MGTGPLVELDVNDPGAAGIDANGNVVGWGSNVFGNLASGNAGAQPVAVPMLGISGALTLTVAFDTTCVVDAANTVHCAGNHLRLGDGSVVDRAMLGAVPIDDVVQLSGGDSAVCALSRDGSVRCWGENKHGELGDGTLVDAPLPTTGPIGPYTTIAAGDTHVCALTVDRHVDCWGNNDSGELGDGTVTRSSTPVRVANVEDATALMLTAITSCALHGDGGVSCWGSNRNGELTIDPSTEFRPTAERIPLTDVVELSGRTALHACAIKRDDTIWCWGNNANAQLGRPASGAEPTPLQVPGVLAD
jgi:alpha-tubulin suppressor-like RCC1 family protein